MAIGVIVLCCGFKYSNRQGDEIPGKQQMEILYFHGHSYVCYRMYYSAMPMSYAYWGGASIVHNPDCKCGKGGGR